ncbi:hypothetical protein ACFQ5M_07850 [Agrilactobacillus yilanensis]|uniref:Uncharacterized protein n=1 Tax=Agrilactobacillus yilanensis TaxID=2485997 RepID=A0ABW4J7P9_9LACO|nr:hypothetical protein [Agrilactobacillus yilanensis]
MTSKVSLKQDIIINLINNVPTALAIPTVAFIVSNTKATVTNWFINVLLAFVVSCIVYFIFPLGKIAIAVPSYFHIAPKNILGRLIGNIPVNFINVLIIGTTLNYYNLRQFPEFIFSLLATIAPIYLVSYLLSTITNIFADKLAFGTTNSIT